MDLKQTLKKEPLKVWFILSKGKSIVDFVGKHSGAFFCPFHDDINKPSAILKTKDKDEIDRVHCFSCGTQYTSYHYVTKVLNLDPVEYIFSNIPEITIKALYNGSQVLTNNISKEKTEKINDLWKESNKDLKVFINKLYLIT